MKNCERKGICKYCGRVVCWDLYHQGLLEYAYHEGIPNGHCPEFLKNKKRIEDRRKRREAEYYRPYKRRLRFKIRRRYR